MSYALKFTQEGGLSSYQGFQWPLPNGKPGAWVKTSGTLVACENGIHACTLAQSFSWMNAECYVIELGGKVVMADDKLVARKGRLVRRVDTWNEKNLRLFAADCAEHVLPIFLKVRPDDDRPAEAIRVARLYARGKATSQERDAAWAAARDAAWAAEREWQETRLAHYLKVPELSA